MRPLAAVGTAMLVATVGLLLSNGASSPGLNIAAAAYAATSSGSGVLEARFVDSMFLAHGRVVTSHHREWIDASTGMRRVQRTLPWLVIRRHAGRQPDAVFELASSPGWLETWDSTAGKLNAIHRIRYPAVVRTPVGVHTLRRVARHRNLQASQPTAGSTANGRSGWSAASVGTVACCGSSKAMTHSPSTLPTQSPCRSWRWWCWLTRALTCRSSSVWSTSYPGTGARYSRKAICSATGACRAALRAKPS